MEYLDYQLDNYHQLFDNSYKEEEETNNCLNCECKINKNQKYCDEICKIADKIHTRENESNPENEMRSTKLLPWKPCNNCTSCNCKTY